MTSSYSKDGNFQQQANCLTVVIVPLPSMVINVDSQISQLRQGVEYGEWQVRKLVMAHVPAFTERQR